MYREPPAPPPTETLHELLVWTAKGRHWVGVLLALAIIGAVALGVTVVSGAPREIEGTEPWMAASIAFFAGPAFVIHRRRRRTARIVRQGEDLALVVDGADVRLSFPLTLRGRQVTMHMNGVPVREVYMQCISPDGRAVVFHETRGAIHGERPNWFDDGIDRGRPGPEFDVGGATALGVLRFEIEQRNKEIAA